MPTVYEYNSYIFARNPLVMDALFTLRLYLIDYLN
jgi:hypothetical protein